MSWWQRWRGKPIAATDRDFWDAWHGTETDAGEAVSEQGAMKLGAYWACARLISETVATLPIKVYERGANGEKRAVTQHDLYPLLHDSPNSDQTAVEFWEGRLLGLCTHGNGFAEKTQRANGSLISLERMPPDTGVSRNRDGALEYRFSDRGKELILPQEKVFHIRGFGDGDVGLSPVSYARQTLGLTRATDRAAAQAFAKGLRSKGFFVMPAGAKAMTADQKSDARKNLVEANSGPNAPWAGILEGGVDFKSVTLSLKDAEMLMNRRFNVEEICRWLRVPPILIGHAAEGQTMFGSGVEQLMIWWLTTGLRPYLTRVEQRAKKDLLTPLDRSRGIFMEFSVEGLLRADSAARAELNAKMVQHGALKPAEWRASENYAPADGADQLFINSTMTPLALAGRSKPSEVV